MTDEKLTPDKVVDALNMFLGKPNDVNFPGDWNTKIYNVAKYIALTGADPVLAELWDNDKDAAYDRKDRLDREKIAKWLFKDNLHPTSKIEWANKWARLSDRDKQYWLDKADQILALMPDVEEVKRKLRAELNAEIRIELGSKAFEKGKREERERILNRFYNKLSEEYKGSCNTPANVNLLKSLFDFLQALRGEGESKKA